MKKNHDITTFIVVAGIIVLSIFTVVLAINLLPNYESNSYYVKVGKMDAKIESLNIENEKLNIITSGNAVEYCAKSTRTTPEGNSLCWKKLQNNQATTSIYKYKKYYVWIKDEEGNISNPTSING